MGESTTPKPDRTGRWTKTLEERFWDKVTPAAADQCWIWAASLNDSGYGQIYRDGMPHKAHRVAYELMIGPIPEGLFIDHLCRVRACVNPWHLDPVPNEVNIRRGVHTGGGSKAKTHCPANHPYSEANTRIDRRGHRRCRECERVQSLAGYYRRKARMEGAA